MALHGRAKTRKKRAVPQLRTRYGRPENKKELLVRLDNERAQREKALELEKHAKERNKDEFHFAYYSTRPNMTKYVELSLDELTKQLRYIDSEILRSEDKLKTGISKANVNKHIRFDDQEIDAMLDDLHDRATSGSSESDDDSDSIYGSISGSESDSEACTSSASDNDSSDKQNEYLKYIKDLKEKRKEIIEKIEKRKKRKSK